MRRHLGYIGRDVLRLARSPEIFERRDAHDRNAAPGEFFRDTLIKISPATIAGQHYREGIGLGASPITNLRERNIGDPVGRTPDAPERTIRPCDLPIGIHDLINWATRAPCIGVSIETDDLHPRR